MTSALRRAFRLFTEMAGVGQVIYLSHHRHLCEIAREVCPNVTIHELPELVLPSDPHGGTVQVNRNSLFFRFKSILAIVEKSTT